MGTKLCCLKMGFYVFCSVYFEVLERDQFLTTDEALLDTHPLVMMVMLDGERNSRNPYKVFLFNRFSAPHPLAFLIASFCSCTLHIACK